MTTIDLAINGRFLSQSTTGVQRVARELVHAIDGLVASGEADFNLRLVCHSDAHPEELALKATTIERAGGLSGYAWEQLVLPSRLGSSALLCLGNTAPMLPLLTGKPVAVMLHDLSHRVFSYAYSPSYRLVHSIMTPVVLSRAKLIITVSETEKAMVTAMQPHTAGRIVVAQNGASWTGSRRIGPRDGPGAAPLPPPGYVLYVGSLSQRKNLAGLMDLSIRLAREARMRFVFVGSRSSIFTTLDRELPDDVAPFVTFEGQVEDDARLEALYRNAACLVLPSFYEASPLPPLEAMVLGCPVVASDIPAMRERCGDAAIYCNPASADSMVAAVMRAVAPGPERDGLIQRGHERAKLFTWTQQARIVLDAVRVMQQGRLQS